MAGKTTHYFEPRRITEAACRAKRIAERAQPGSDAEFLLAERDYFLTLVSMFVDKDECEYDANGLCEVHMHLTQGTKCPHDEARYLLEANGWTP